jgi:hypothetical protein
MHDPTSSSIVFDQSRRLFRQRKMKRVSRQVGASRAFAEPPMTLDFALVRTP